MTNDFNQDRQMKERLNKRSRARSWSTLVSGDGISYVFEREFNKTPTGRLLASGQGREFLNI